MENFQVKQPTQLNVYRGYKEKLSTTGQFNQLRPIIFTKWIEHTELDDSKDDYILSIRDISCDEETLMNYQFMSISSLSESLLGAKPLYGHGKVIKHKFLKRIQKGEQQMELKSMLEVKKNQMENLAINYGMEKVKKHFGKEFLLQVTDSSTLVSEVIMKFIKKYDPKFESHTQKGNSDTPMIINTQFMVKFDKQTYMYLASGNKIGNTEERFLMSSNISSQDLYMYIFGKHMIRYVKELEKLTHDMYCSNELGIFTIDATSSRRGDDEGETLDVTYSSLATRNLNTLFFSSGEKEKICSHINRFNDNEDFYTEKQLLYKTGILLYGEPGTGKSSLVKALASTYNRSIVNVNVSNIKRIDLNRLTQSINVDENRRYIILLEDIDTLFLNREDGESDKEDQSIINKLLQFLDSNTSPTNVVFIATTNHIERLDSALLREGRFDLKVQVNPLNALESYSFGESFGLSHDVMNGILLDLDNDFPEKQGYNQSSLQARILSKIENKSKEKAKELYGEMNE